MTNRLYTTVKTTNVATELIQKAYDFSLKVTDTINYADSNQTIKKKIQDDHFVSKIGEAAAYNVLQEYGTVSLPDYEIYPASIKSWQEDLFMDGIGIAIKTQRRTAALRYGLSWTFQWSPQRKDRLLEHPDAWVIFVEYNDQNPYECHVYPPFQIKELTFLEPKLAHLQNNKKVVYAQTLPIPSSI